MGAAFSSCAGGGAPATGGMTAAFAGRSVSPEPPAPALPAGAKDPHPAGPSTGAPAASVADAAAPAPAAERRAAAAAASAPAAADSPAGGALDDDEAALAAAAAELAQSRVRGDFREAYKLGRLIGHGAYAKVYEATPIAAAPGQAAGGGGPFAVKVVPKLEGEEAEAQREAVVKEIAIARRLEGHPAATRLHCAWEGDSAFYLVTDLWAGGELFDQICARGQFSEREAAALVGALLSFIAHAHAKGVCHRDLKPENIMMASAGAGGAAGLRVIDYGTSEFCPPGERLTHKFGTPYYVAPEVLQKSYDCRADVWSAGVILYILLCGSPPFAGVSDERILAKVKRGSYSFAAKEWASVSEEGKHLVTLMLTVEPDVRPPASELLSHPWLAPTAAPPAPGSPLGAGAGGAALGAAVVSRLREFAGMSRIKRLALVVLARTLDDREVARLRDLFMAMDSDDNGRITADELQRALQQVGAAMDPDELRQAIAASALGGGGAPGAGGGDARGCEVLSIDYERFLAAMIDSNRVARRAGALRRSFQSLDVDSDGVISVRDLAAVLQTGDATLRADAAGRARSVDLAASIVSEVGGEGKGGIDFEDFRRLVWGAPGAAAGGVPLAAAAIALATA